MVTNNIQSYLNKECFLIRVNNEWDRLREVFVGTAEYANNPIKSKDLHCINYADKDNIHGIQQGLYPQQVIEETQEDLENFVNQLESFGIKVKRPKPQNQQEYFSSPHWDTNGYYNYCAVAIKSTLSIKNHEICILKPENPTTN